MLDRSGRILEAQGAAAEILMASALTAKDGGQRLPGIVEMRLADPECRRLRMKASASRFIEVWLNGERRQPAKGGLRGLLVRDISKQYQDERKLIRLAHFDSLTGLPNRRLFLEKIQAELTDAARSGSVTALLYLDLDQFKEINDTHGHSAGDAVLKQLAARLVSSLGAGAGGESSAPEASRISVSRLSGDEFAIIASRVADAEAARELARRILRIVAEPLTIAERSLSASASVGIALFPKDGSNVEALIRCADAAVYTAKNRGRNGLAFYEPAIDAGMERISKIASGLRSAIERGELSLHYQPKIDLATGTAAGLEALMRWKSAELGDVSPKDFIPVAEERGLIPALGAWSLEQACQQIARWREAGYAPVRVSVNVSSIQFRDSDLQRRREQGADTAQGRSLAARNRADREPAARRGRADGAVPARPAGDGRDGRPRRLRDRLLGAHVPERLPARRAEDGPRASCARSNPTIPPPRSPRPWSRWRMAWG